MKKRILSLFLALLMLFSLLPAAIPAAAEEDLTAPTELDTVLPQEPVEDSGLAAEPAEEPEPSSEPEPEPELEPELTEEPAMPDATSELPVPSEEDASVIPFETESLEKVSASGANTSLGNEAGGLLDSGTCGPDLSWTMYESGTLVISGVGSMTDVSPTNRVWRDYSGSIQEIVVTEGVTSICDNAFKTVKSGSSSVICSYTNVTSVSLPSTLEAIGNSAFNGCTALSDLSLSEGLKSIGSNAFENCAIKSLVIPASVESIGNAAFSGCSSLEHLSVLPAQVSIGLWAFSCSALTSAGPLGSGCDYEFQNWNTEIPANAFNGCSGLTRVLIPDTVTCIGNAAFANCAALEELSIPSGVTAIGREAFTGCSSLTSVTLPQGIHVIEYGLFSGCSALSSIGMPDVVTEIGYSAFQDCASLTVVTLSDEVSSIGQNAFSGCSRLNAVILPEKLSSIENSTFYKCSSLKAILIPKSVVNVGNAAFRYCDQLAYIYYTGMEDEWQNITIGKNNEVLSGCANIFYNSSKADLENRKSVSGVIQVGEGWALRWSCDYLEDLAGNCRDAELKIYMDGVDPDGDGKFITSLTENESSPWLTETGFDKAVFSRLSITGNAQNPLRILSNQFYAYTGLLEISLAHIEGIYSGAFQDCSSLTHVSSLDSSLLSIGQAAFKNDVKLTSIDGSGDAVNLASIGDEAFLNTGLSEFVFLESLEGIGDEAFANTHLTSVELFDRLSTIGTGAFRNTGMAKATIGPGVTSIGSEAFAGCPDLILYCYADSEAYRYAIENHLNYRVIDESFDMLLEHPSTDYDKKLAVIAAELSMATYTAGANSDSDVKEYLYTLGFQDQDIYSNNYGGSLAFTLAVKPFVGESTDGRTDVLVIAAQGSTNPYELYNDAFSSTADCSSGHPYSSFSIVNDFYNAIDQGIAHMRACGILRSDRQCKILLTGHSLGGAAADMMAASLTDQYGAANVFCYTFGAINSIHTNRPVGYGNIHNIYNDLDTFSPYQYGKRLLNQSGMKFGKFGHLDSFAYEYREPETVAIDDYVFQMAVHINHDMGNYLEAVRSGRVKRSSCPYSIVACPVDVEVYCGQELVGRVTNNLVDSAVTTIDILVSGDVKFIFYPDNRLYTLKIRAYDEGTMLFCTQRPDGTGGCRLIEDVALTPGKTMSSTIDGEQPVDSIKLLVVDEKDLPLREIRDDGSEVTYVPDSARSLSALTLEHKYLILTPGQEAALLPSDLPQELTPYLRWSSDNTEVAAVDAAGMASALQEGTAWISVSLDTGEQVLTAYCRIDVVEGEEGEEHPVAADVTEETNGVSGVRLTAAKAAVELFKTDYTRIQILPELTRNYKTAQTTLLPTPAPAEDAGAAVESARFTVPAVADLFNLRVVDDRTLELIPTQAALDNYKLVKGSYASPIAVTLDGTEFTTDTLTLTVKKTEPKLTAKAVTLNSFLRDTQRVSFSGGTVLSAVPDPAKALPDWLRWDSESQTFTYLGAQNAKQSAKVTLLVSPAGWAVQRAVTVSVSAKSTAPKLSFKPASLTLKPGTGDSAATSWTLSPALFAGEAVTLSRISEGKTDYANGEVLNVSLQGGSAVVTAPTVDGKAHSYKVWLAVAGKEYAFTVKTLADKQAVSLSLKAAGSIDLAVPGSPVTITASTKNFHAEQAAFTLDSICLAKTTADLSSQFSITSSGNILTITALGDLQPGTYTATITADLGGEPLSKSVNFTVKRSAKVPTAALTVKASGSIDVLRPSTSVTVTPTVKNRYGYTLSPDDISITRTYDGTRKCKVQEDATGLFSVAVQNGKYTITALPGAHLSHADKFSVQADMAGLRSKAVALSVKQGSARLGLSSKSVTLLKTDRYSRGNLLLSVMDPSLAGIARVELDSKSAALFSLIDLGGGRYAIGYAGDLITTSKAQTVKLQVYLLGNETAKPNATFSVKVNFA